MNKEELKVHCEKQIKRYKPFNDLKHLEEHLTILKILEENEELKEQIIALETCVNALKKGNDELQNKLEQCKAVADTNKELADSYYNDIQKAIEYIKGKQIIDLDYLEKILGSDSNENNISRL